MIPIRRVDRNGFVFDINIQLRKKLASSRYSINTIPFSSDDLTSPASTKSAGPIFIIDDETNTSYLMTTALPPLIDILTKYDEIMIDIVTSVMKEIEFNIDQDRRYVFKVNLSARQSNIAEQELLISSPSIYDIVTHIVHIFDSYLQLALIFASDTVVSGSEISVFLRSTGGGVTIVIDSATSTMKVTGDTLDGFEYNHVIHPSSLGSRTIDIIESGYDPAQAHSMTGVEVSSDFNDINVPLKTSFTVTEETHEIANELMSRYRRFREAQE